MILTTETGTSIELNDIVNLDTILSRYFNNRYFSAANAKIWKSKVTHFCRNSGYFRERIKDASGQGFCYKIGQVQPDGETETILFNLTASKSLQLFRKFQEPKPVF